MLTKLSRPALKKGGKNSEPYISPRTQIRLQANPSKTSSEFLANIHKINFNPKFKENGPIVGEYSDDYGLGYAVG